MSQAPPAPAIAVQLDGKPLTDKYGGVRIHHGQPFCSGYYFLVPVEPATAARSLQIKNTVARKYEIVSLQMDQTDEGFFSNSFHKINPFPVEVHVFIEFAIVYMLC